jgi:hypothetical protein
VAATFIQTLEREGLAVPAVTFKDGTLRKYLMVVSENAKTQFNPPYPKGFDIRFM